ncbi:YceD family protein [Salinisphaera sp. Q1T1-3]|uniref:YceD family protein n=1 Tax=Salinisphaera sp. Q1T1-3 TaxID=2321229 RepID=UPI000E75BED4|nr:YceD family protein [Salinisphaera sp. Q1T1-3]RJS95366.1 hypothetical protein D3260_02150 [Salinisphaera sp. Q1T1-3]
MSAQGSFPRHIDYRRAALEQRSFDGVLTLASLPRTADIVVEDTTADVSVALAFDEDVQRRVIVRGRAQTTLALPCQRCLEPADVPLDAEIVGMPVATDEAAAGVPRAWEPMLADGGTLDLYSLVDDELLLALPITVHCDRAACVAAYSQDTTDETIGSAESDAESDRRNPFAALADWKPRSDETD